MGVFTDRSALLIIDMIRDFVEPDGALPVPGAENIVPVIAALAAEAREMGVPVIHVTDSHDPNDREFETWGRHAVTGSAGAEIAGGLEPEATDYRLEKKRFSAFFGTDLEKILEEQDIDHLVLAGTVTNICIYSTAMDAVMRGYKVTVPEDAVVALNQEDHEFAIRQIRDVLGAEVI